MQRSEREKKRKKELLAADALADDDEDDEELEFDNGDPYIAFWAATNINSNIEEERVIASLADSTSSDLMVVGVSDFEMLARVAGLQVRVEVTSLGGSVLGSTSDGEGMYRYQHDWAGAGVTNVRWSREGHSRFTFRVERGGEEWVNSVVLQREDLVGYTESDHDVEAITLLLEAAFGLKGIRQSTFFGEV
jgi:hypothetical protein